MSEAQGTVLTAEAGGAAPPPDARAWLPEEYRADPTFKDIGDAAALAKSYKHAAGFVGLDKSTVLRLPKDEAAPEWADVWNRLGRPEKPEGYEVAAPDGLAPEVLTAFQARAHALGLSKKQAADLMGFYGEQIGASASARQEAEGATVVEQVAALKQEWGGAFKARAEAIETFVEQVGGKDALPAVDALIKGGHTPMLNLLAKAAEAMLEKGTLRGSNAGGGMGGALDPSQAREEWTRLQRDPEWNKRYLGGGADEAKRARELFAAMHPAQAA